MLIRHLFLGVLGAMIGGVVSASSGWSVWVVVGLVVLGGNFGLLSSALAVLVPWPGASTRLAPMIRSSASDPASLPPAE